MLRRFGCSGLFLVTALAVGAGLPLLSSCGPKAPRGSEMSEARLEASETKLVQLEERLAELESKTSRLDGVPEGVQVLLEKLDELNAGGEARARKPSSTAVYSMPIEGDPFVGPVHAKVTLVQGYDFYCGYCDKVRPVLTQLQSLYGEDLKIVFKNFVIHDEVARLPALAACAAHKQNKFMPIFEQIWIQGIRARQELSEDQLIAMAKAQKIHQKRFLSDMHGECEAKIQEDFESMAAVGTTGTPAFYINGRFLAGALPIQSYQRIIDQELAKANRVLKSGVKLKDYYQSQVVEAGLKSL